MVFEDATDEERALQRDFENAVLSGLWVAGVIPAGSKTYTKRDIERGLNAVRDSIIVRETPRLLALMTRATNQDPLYRATVESIRTLTAAEVAKIAGFEGPVTKAERLALDRLESFVIEAVGGPADERDVARVFERVREAWAEDIANAGAAAPILLGVINYVMNGTRG